MPKSRTRKTAIAILAAGKGTRLKSKHPKVLHEVGGKPLLSHVIAAATHIVPPKDVYAIIGHEADRVREAVAGTGIDFVLQEEQLGTGHALMLARYNVANTFATTRPADPTKFSGAFVPLDQLRKYTRFSTKKTVNNFLSALNVSIDKATQTALRSYLGKDDAGNPVTWDPSTDAAVDKKIRGLIHLIMSLPEFSMN